MNSPESLYKLFNLQADCLDEELRHAYHQLVLANHPDSNPENVDQATKKTQQINEAYSLLKEYRLNPDRPLFELSSDEIDEFKIIFDFGKVNKKDIARRKSEFRIAWDAFYQQPSDVFLALRLIHASFEAERYKEISELLKKPVTIDASVLLLNIINHEAALTTLIRWADQLRSFNLPELGLQILEDVYSTGENRDSFLDTLRSFHYGIAQGYWKEIQQKPDPNVRIKHLARILEIGYELDYVYKLLAEAHHEMREDEDATVYLKKAYKINPELSGAIRISRALGFLPEKEKKPKRKRKKYTYTRPDQIPHPSKIREWASCQNWEQIFSFSNLALYSPRIIPKARSTIRQIAKSLGDCPDKRAKEFLLEFQSSVYWDVREASNESLDRFGQKGKSNRTLDLELTDSQDLEEKLWSQLLWEDYHPANDDGYLRALNILSARVMTFNDPDDLLGALLRTTRWLELLGMSEMTQWIRDFIRREAPGTWYVDKHDRVNYVKEVQVSDRLERQIKPLLSKIQQMAPIRLAMVLGSASELEQSKKYRKMLEQKSSGDE